jgi:ElaA protein
MHSIQWQWRHFSELTTTQLFHALQLRAKIFIVEQQDAYLDPDEQDEHAWHALGYQQGQLITYARVIINSESLTIGRVVVEQTWRGQGIASCLLTEILRWISQSPYQAFALTLSAQAHLVSFYQQFGFSATSEAYAIGPIMHIDMDRGPVS